MASVKTIRRELTFLIFSEIYLKFDQPKARRKAISIVEAAIHCISRKGFDEVTLEMVAREAGVTRPLLKYYFKDLAELREISIKYIRFLFQKIAIDAMTKGQGPDHMLKNYVDACFEWVKNFKPHAAVWFRFMNTCMVDKKSRALNTVAVMAGEERIAGLLERGNLGGIFDVKDAVATAKTLQVIITGALIASISEDLSDPVEFQKAIRQTILQLVQIQKNS